MEEWHQKLHNNTSPDDVAICQALLAYLQHDLDISHYWATLEVRQEAICPDAVNQQLHIPQKSYTKPARPFKPLFCSIFGTRSHWSILTGDQCRTL